MTVRLTNEQMTELRNLIQDDNRTAYYVKYHEFTKTGMSLQMASISSFAGFVGGVAEAANIDIQNDLGDLYPYTDIFDFSREIATAHFNKVEESFCSEGGERCLAQ